MTDDLSRLSFRIRESLTEIDRVLERINIGWNRFQSSSDDIYLDSVALHLHNLYSGLERIFSLITEVIGGEKPTGENWHQNLLKRVTMEIPGVRPAVISIESLSRLYEFRGFRHIVRNVYTYKFNPDRI